MTIRKYLPWILLLILVFLSGWVGVRYLVPRTIFAPDDPALTAPDGAPAAAVSDEPAISDPTESEDSVEEAPEPGGAVVDFDDLDFTMEVLAENLTIPWEMLYLPEVDDWLLTQRSGELVSLTHGTVAVIEETDHTGEGGLLGMAAHPDFDGNRLLYLYTTTRSGNQLINRVLRYTYENQALSDRTVILDDIPGARFHNGGRIAFGPDGMLYVTTGDAGDPPLAQRQDSLAGKILRLTPEGAVPADNPYPGSPVYSLGHRNPQGMAWHPETGDLYASEHGPTQMDEVNLIHPGGNYGWPLVTCDEAPTDYEDPIACYSGFTLAPSGMTFYTPPFVNGTHLLVAGLRGNQVRHLALSPDGTVMSQEVLFSDWGRIRAVNELEGDLYVITNNRDGRGTPQANDDRFIRLRVDLPD
ncbi:MAG: PQQ-dependent sugar dehydrogenase [Bacillota bacterium]|nr:PQQ-dependent sugar dehydrogenase [Bacillota bacterium]MDW7677183.1 PQQ-dependent sugar dehydrogenase [Bacillota bacterium]